MLAGFLILPMLWSVPEALITAELATAFPENSGYVAWVTAAFGPFWGFQEGFWSWLSGVTDNSIYPVMFADNLRIFIPALNDGWPRCVLRQAAQLLPGYCILLALCQYQAFCQCQRHVSRHHLPWEHPQPALAMFAELGSGASLADRCHQPNW